MDAYSFFILSAQAPISHTEISQKSPAYKTLHATLIGKRHWMVDWSTGMEVFRRFFVYFAPGGENER
jgi:hypothetical protein